MPLWTLPRKAPPAEPIDFSRTMGVDCCISTVIDGGQRLKLYGWTDEPVEDGRLVILMDRATGRTSQYRLEAVRRPGDPPDMWFADAVFTPRDNVLR
jgi:hypothetical protein